MLGLWNDFELKDWIIKIINKVSIGIKLSIMKNKTKQIMSEMMFKTREELLAEPRENLTVHEQVAQEMLKEKPDMTLERAIELLEMIP
mgnify:CR=1 FL=1